MVLQVNTNSVPDQQSLYPDGQHTLAFYTKCVQPVGPALLLALNRADVIYLLPSLGMKEEAGRL